MGEIRGYHVFIGFALAFGIIIAVNITLAVNAITTFPGLMVKNSYVASQGFEDRRTQQSALGWTVNAQLEGDTLYLSVKDKYGAVRPEIEVAEFGRPTHTQNDQTLEFALEAGLLSAPVTVSSGQWILDLQLRAEDGTPFRQIIDLWVPTR